MQDLETFYPTSKQHWREWLQENHTFKQSIWLVCYKKQANVPTITWSDAVDEALCFGWIDSTRKSIDSDKFIQFFTRRKPNSIWSKINKEKIERLISEGLMFEAGLESVEKAKQNGSWIILDTVEALFIPQDLEIAFESNPGAKDFFLSLSKSVKKMILYWIVAAKRPETRQNRINEVAILAAQNLKPKHIS
ncbi:YdeI family protein [Flavobacterium sp. CLA17]|uniref:YdeI/OmpD-associated family protein n=1 Tax=Flavobacterium sp. CLA17 TaxID=2724135 RepID=UPI0014924171|nr:YdeI/OmpD-associated family protein [Flavobacterium sp. CLA17]QSB25118.1 YdeI/OmpD-associated family protein [Flavobacterium sp. CLA17]